MTTMFIDTNGEMSFGYNERLKFIMHYLKQGADDSLVEMKDGRFVREDSELSFTEIWLPAAEHQQRKIDEQQAKVEELKATIKGNHGRIAELERLNRVKAQAIIDLHQEITELKASHHGEVIGHEVHFKKIKQERDELQTLYTQQGINMLKLQKRVDQQGLIIAKAMSIASDLQKSWSMFEIGKKLEQAIKGGGQ
ncbi:hypothetical protein [Acinetobacter nosocomialis]|uniref:hypothetical protein n=1 Tax=Acinetobacter nosocomialis TaxID=106654 RepID=UPI001D0EF92E|nr:hypothetical protein [Acinetobacter nosocomialis]